MVASTATINLKWFFFRHFCFAKTGVLRTSVTLIVLALLRSTPSVVLHTPCHFT